jgi:Tol biopolymer transport system component
MGEVYRARDTRLGRQVAVKILPAQLAGDRDRLRRFEQEARAAGALNHHAILAVYDVGQHGATPYIVSELLEGESLRARLASGPLPPRKAVEYAMHVAQGLAAAHDRHIVHRDLKPDNIFVTRDGSVKILDFGLAKLTEVDPLHGDDSRETPTRTQAGSVMGTPGYMSPEQVRGETADHRADIFALGAILYEMLSGRRAFRGGTVPETLAAVLSEDPPQLAKPNAVLPHGLERLVRHCLEKRAEQRVQSARDIVLWLQSLSEIWSRETASPAGREGRVRVWVALLACAATGILAWALVRPRAPAGRFPKRLVLGTLDEYGGISSFIPFALSPDGRLFVHTSGRSSESARSHGFPTGQASQLWLRSLDEADSRPLAGTEGGHEPFFSPDGKWVGFWAGGELRKVPSRGGPAVTLCAAADLWGASWGPDGTIAFGTGEGAGLRRVRDGGGAPVELTRLVAGEIAHLWPQLLPEAGAVLFTIRSPTGDRVALHSLASGHHTVLVEDGGMARFVRTGHIVYARRGTLYMAPVDLGRQQLTGPSAPLPEAVFTGDLFGNSLWSVSDEGSLAFVSPSAGSKAQRLAWVDRMGRARPFLGPRRIAWPRLSPDARLIAFKDDEGSGDIWVYDVSAETLVRVTLEGTQSQAAWAPGGDRIVYAERSGKGFALMSRPAHGGGSTEPLLRSEARLWPGSWSPDGRTLFFSTFGVNSTGDILSLHLGQPPAPAPLLVGPSNDWGPIISPDGRSLAYASDRSGRFEVYLERLADPASRRQVSTDGGTEPVWSRDGSELFFRSGSALVSLPVKGSLPSGKPARLFHDSYLTSVPGLPNYDAAPDGRFLMVMPAEPTSERPVVHIVLDWFEELKAPAAR